jgi:uncharacterized membrane-anchored protein
MRRWIALGLAAAVLAAVNGLILHKEWIVRHGQAVYLRLAPVDPRSLMQGDYMVLDYEVSRAVGDAATQDGRIVVALDADSVARFARFDDGRALGPGEVRLRYRRRAGRVRLGAESFFFQEGHAHLYDAARYGELRVAPSGDCVLVGLCDGERRALGRK